MRNRRIAAQEPSFELSAKISQNRTFARPIWSEVYRKATERRRPSLVAPAFQLRFALPCGLLLLDFHVPIVAMSVKVPVEPMLYIETSFEPEFVT